MVLTIAIASCLEASVSGEDFIEREAFELSLDSSFPLELSTIRFDSLVTSASDRLLVGGAKDAPFGTTEIVSYFQVNLVGALPTFSLEDYRYDSATLTVPMDGYSVYLTEETIPGTLILEQLQGELEYLEDESALYNYSEIPGATDLTGDLMSERSFFWSTDRIRELDLRLSDAWGSELFARMQAADDIFRDGTTASEYQRGFRLYLKDPSFAFGLTKDSLKVTLHLTDQGSSNREILEVDFHIDTRPYYSKVVHSEVPEGLAIENLQDELPSDRLGDLAYIVGGLGYAAKVDSSGVRDLLLDGKDFILVNAELQLRWLEHDSNIYPENLVGLFVDEDLVDIAQGQRLTMTSMGKTTFTASTPPTLSTNSRASMSDDKLTLSPPAGRPGPRPLRLAGFLPAFRSMAALTLLTSAGATGRPFFFSSLQTSVGPALGWALR